MRIVKGVFCIAIIGLLTACGSKRKAVERHVVGSERAIHKKTSDFSSERDYPDNIKHERNNRSRASFESPVEYYIYKFAPVAMNEMELYGIPASITLAQGILESGSGRGKLTRKSNNHFGIKCNGWKGEKVYHDDDKAQECFRKYKDAKYSFRDHSLFLSGRRRYAFLFSLRKDDYKAWARGLKKAGYATDPRYPQKLISLIEKYQLDRYDEQVLQGKSRNGKPFEISKVNASGKQYTVKDDDTLWSIAKRFGLTVQELKRFNNLRSNVISIGQKLYVEAH